MMKQFAVYILASQRNGTLYIGVTSDLVKRIWQHKEKLVEGFTADYDVDRLVYFEMHENAESAIMREKQVKKWKRAWKLRLVEEMNPEWKDLYEEILFRSGLRSPSMGFALRARLRRFKFVPNEFVLPTQE